MFERMLRFRYGLASMASLFFVCFIFYQKTNDLNISVYQLKFAIQLQKGTLILKN
ncbi:hypothetical protein SAMN04488023_13324 [Pedobacter rhizosphaerae]|uniref:Uncharacterized protein n=1 Tax=Pedobacter rhizosphaerae TaxID=390241 RepID=A0A1H9URL4_9SPHI|nr:hypothetical protein SAMN04488023_13324 [Pedobacter rhizosphaerae]